ncbi:MAG: sigma-E factor negative regulatory protein [Betaproteobacteria bacterium]|nr:sigma-E factor negative regulatory protein [Betaproteobacteria bacterium]MDH5222889.1 sigma-E factor negative regulatory protein [Betaproteobacteria bacterium]MDH5350677.1 sigma-E factor negative regulatory protein [Betaproteobacteria bacterium]
MVEDTKSRISALMDSELDAREAQASLVALREDVDARAAWHTYHLISDAIQGRAKLGMRCAHRVSARLAHEPALIGPLPSAVAAAQRPRWFVPSALAASLAAVALVGWMAFAPQPRPGPGIGELARAPAPALVSPAVQKRAEPARVPMTVATRDYLLAHQAYSPRNSLLGVAPYVRSVSAEAAPGKP